MTAMSPRRRLRLAPAVWPVAAVMLLVLQLPALRAIARYSHGFTVPVVAASALFTVGVVAWWGGRTGARRAWTDAALVIGLLLVMAACAHWLYPIADGLKAHMRGSDADDAVQVVVRGVLNGERPYSQQTYMKTPLSPGPGLLLLYGLFVPWGGYAFGAVAAIGAVAGALRRTTGAWRAPACFLSLIATSLFFWEMLVVGSDLILVGCGLAVVALVVRERRHPAVFAACVTLLGLLATARIVLLYVPWLLAVAVWQRSKRASLAIALGATGVALALHAGFYTWATTYSPLHLLGKGQSLMPWPIRVATAIACLAVAAWALGPGRRRPQATLELLLLGLGAPLLGIASAELVHRGGSLTAWEGANYLMPLLPIAAAWAAERLSRVEGAAP